MRIIVTEKDIQRGQRGSHRRCPIALAVNRVFPLYQAVVYTNRLTIDPMTQPGVRTAHYKDISQNKPVCTKI